MAITLVVGLVMAGVTLPLASAGALRQYWWVLACIPVILIGLYPPVTKFGLDIVLRIIRRPALDKPLSLGGMARAVGWTTLGWMFYGVHAWLLVGDIAGKSLHILLLSAGGYALAWAVGFLLIPFPGGIGPREIALIAVLSPVMPRGPALVIALASRVVMTVGRPGLRRAGRRDRPPRRPPAPYAADRVVPRTPERPWTGAPAEQPGLAEPRPGGQCQLREDCGRRPAEGDTGRGGGRYGATCVGTPQAGGSRSGCSARLSSAPR